MWKLLGGKKAPKRKDLRLDSQEERMSNHGRQILDERLLAPLAPPAQINAEQPPEMDTGHVETAPGLSQASDDYATVGADSEEDDVVIAVMGPTRSGKSTFVRRASEHNDDDDDGVHHVLRSCTSDVLAFRFWDQGSGRNVVLIDTPGFDDTFKSDLDILNIISDWLNSSYKKEKLLSGILYLHRITDNRMAGTPLKNLRVFQKLCGNDALNKVYLTTTMWDEVEPSVGEKRLAELTQEYWKTMVNQGAHIARCRNDDDSAKKLIRQILDQETIRKMVLPVDENTDLERLVEQQGCLRRRIDEERKKALDLLSMAEELQREYNELQVQIDGKLCQLKSPRSPCRTEEHSLVLVTPPQANAEQQPKVNTEHAETAPGLPRASDDYAVVNAEDLQADDVVIAVMGPTGSGKSTFIRRATGYDDDRGVGHGLNSFTSDVLAFRFRDQESGRHVVLVDTPSFNDTFKSDLDILNMIADWLNSSYKEKLLSGILYLHRITDNRMTGTLLRNLRVFRKLCGKDALDKVYLMTTMWDEIEPDIGEKRLTELKQEYWKSMVKQGAQIACCRNDDDSAKKLIQRILEQETVRGAILLQEEMTELKKELKETRAEQELFSQLEKLVEGQLALLRRIDEERKKASDSSMVEELQTEYNKTRLQIDEKLRQMRELKLSRLKTILRFFRKRDWS